MTGERTVAQEALSRFWLQASQETCAENSSNEPGEIRPQIRPMPRGANFFQENQPGMVEPRGIEPLTSAMPLQRSPS